MRKVIGIVGEGPTDYMVIKEVIDHITGEGNEYRRLQPEPDTWKQKRASVYSQLLPRLCEQWERVIEQCYSARCFDDKVKQIILRTAIKFVTLT